MLGTEPGSLEEQQVLLTLHPHKNTTLSQVVVAHAFTTSTWEAEASSRTETLSQKNKNKKTQQL